MTSLGKTLHFNAENFWWPFLVIDRILSFACLSCLKSDIYNIYDPFQRKYSSFTPIFLASSYFPTLPITLLLKIFGGRMHGPSPTSNFWGTIPRPPKSPPMSIPLKLDISPVNQAVLMNIFTLHLHTSLGSLTTDWKALAPNINLSGFGYWS